MPAPRHLRVTYSGVFGTVVAPVEQWQFGLSLIATPASVYERPQLTTLSSTLSGLFSTHLVGRVTSQARLTRTRIACVGADGKTERDAVGAYRQGDTVSDIPGTGTTMVPLSTALAISLLSAFEGPVGRGRFYLPTPVLGTVEAAGTISATTQTTIQSSMAAFLNAINALSDGGGGGWGLPDGIVGRVCIASGGSAAQAIPAALRPVVAIATGRVPDVQTRRSDDQDEQKVRLNLA